MFQRMIDDFKDSTGRALRLTSLAAAMALALGVTISFLCAAAFVYVLQRYGLIEACLTGAGVFFVVTLIAAGCYLVRKRQVKARAAETASSARCNTARASVRNVRPASVNRTDLALRSKSGKPISSSRSWICRLKAGCETCSFVAARVTFSVSATATK